jgi:TRAP-type C4-dicarboxylate transport system substrate-binding protein
MTYSRRDFLRVAALTTSALAAPSILRAQEARTLRLGITTPPGHPWNEAAKKVGEALKAETKGRLDIAVFPANQLGNEGAMLQQMQAGSLDIGWISAAELGSRIPSIAAITAPWVVDSTAKAGRLVKHPIAEKLLEVLPAETGTVGLGWALTTMRVVFTAKEVAGLEDLNGMKLRINTTPAYRDFYQLLGTAPTPIPTPQVFDAMANGQVDGLEADLDFSWNQRFDKVAKTMLKVNAVFMPCAALVSGRVWQSVAAADRELITRLTKEALSAQVDATVANEARLLDEFGKVITVKEISMDRAGEIITEYDKVWLPKAPILADLRKTGAAI